MMRVRSNFKVTEWRRRWYEHLRARGQGGWKRTCCARCSEHLCADSSVCSAGPQSRIESRHPTVPYSLALPFLHPESQSMNRRRIQAQRSLSLSQDKRKQIPPRISLHSFQSGRTLWAPLGSADEEDGTSDSIGARVSDSSTTTNDDAVKRVPGGERGCIAIPTPAQRSRI